MATKSKLLLAVVLVTVLDNLRVASAADQDWWKHAVFYQIYPRSFKDSNNDGVGDIQGIISKLDHLKDAGVTAAWLSPIYKSPQVDQGYDISDFEDIQEEYGTMKDFENLIAEAHKRDIKIVMDFVPNHSSDQHKWFLDAIGENPKFKDYYIWRDKDKINNWLSVFKYSAWNCSYTQCFLHQFANAQPDLNYRNDSLVTEMKNVLRFWLRKGVDGFRMDAVPFLFEDDQFRNEPPSNYANVPNYNSASLRHVYTQDLPETFDMIYQWRTVLNNFATENSGDARVMMTEVYTDVANTMYYFGNDKQEGAHFTFNFYLITDLNINSTARDVMFAIEKWQRNKPSKYVSNWVVGNHDQHRVATRLKPENVDSYNMLVALLPGIMVTYNGEEIGQENGEVTYEQGKDPNACNATKEEFALITRDVARTPYQWDNSTNAGFNNGTKTWLPVSSKYISTNLANQQNPNVSSHYQIYKQLTKLRQNDNFKNGDLQIRAVTDNVLVFSRAIAGGASYVMVLNLGGSNETINVNQATFSATQFLEVVISNLKSTRKKGDLIPTINLKLRPYESLVTVTTTRVITPTVPPPIVTPGTNDSSSVTPTTEANGAPSSHHFMGAVAIFSILVARLL